MTEKCDRFVHLVLLYRYDELSVPSILNLLSLELIPSSSRVYFFSRLVSIHFVNMIKETETRKSTPIGSKTLFTSQPRAINLASLLTKRT